MPQNRFHVVATFARVAAVCGATSLTGCAGQGLTKTGFLTNYDQMKPQPEHTDDAIYVAPGYAPTKYSKVIVDPVRWMPKHGAPARETKTIAMLQQTFHEDLVRKLGEHYTVIPASDLAYSPNENILRVRAAITNTRRALWYVNVPVQAAAFATGGVGLFGPSSGGASEELEAVDGHTGKPEVKIATYNNGMPWNVVGSYVAYNHARRAFVLASELMRDELQVPPVTTISPLGRPVGRSVVAIDSANSEDAPRPVSIAQIDTTRKAPQPDR